MTLESISQFFTQESSYILKTFIVIFIALTIDLTQRKVVKRLSAQALKTANPWDDAILDALRKPLSLIIWAVGIFVATQIIQDATQGVIFNAMGALRDAVVIGALAWFLIRMIANGERNILERKKDADKTTIDAICKLLRISVMITAVLVTLQTLGFSISGLLAFGGIGGIAIGFAAKDLLANFFGGLMIYLDRPFAVGDWIRSPDKEIEGTVEKIGWRLTVIRTFDKRPLYVPNSIFAQIVVENPQRMQNRRILEFIGLRYDDASKVRGIVREVEDMLTNHPEIDTDQGIGVHFSNFAPSSMDFRVSAFTKTTSGNHFREIKQDILLKIVDIIEQQGAEMAFPTSTVHLADQEILKHFNSQT